MEQAEPLLRTKLFIPPLRSNLVARPRLLEKLASGLDKPLTLVSAPAGYGKTTLTSAWLKTSPMPAAWLSLDENDNDPIRFMQYFLAALHLIIPSIDLDLLDIIKGAQAAQYESLAGLLINEIEKNGDASILVLDDVHAIHERKILEFLSYFVCHLPQRLHLVLLSRSDPPMPLARLRARNQLLDLRADQLRFSGPEITSFLNESMGLDLDKEDLAAMAARTEGWIAGLQLAALSLQGCVDLHAFVAAFAGSHHYIMDYLVEEVLKTQPPEVSTFLLHTSILERMCAPLCDALLPQAKPAAGNSQAVLEDLERKNLFVISQDRERRWYRYHHLFLDVLNRRLEYLFPDILPELHGRAAHWYEENGYLPQAIQHTLKAGQKENAARLVEENGCFLLMSGEVITLLDWIRAIDVHAQSRPWIIVQKGWALTLAGLLEQVEPVFRQAEQVLAAQESAPGCGTLIGTIAAGRAFLANALGDSPAAVVYARRALQSLTDRDLLSLSMRSVANLILGEASWLNGNLAEARRIYEEAASISQAANNVPILISNTIDLAVILIEQGHLHQALSILNDVLQLASQPDGRSRSTTGRIYQQLFNLHYQWNDLAHAQEDVEQCILAGEQWQDGLLLCDAELMLARLEFARGKTENAQRRLHKVEQKMDVCRLSSAKTTRLRAGVASLGLSLGDAHWASSFLAADGIAAESRSGSCDTPYLQDIKNLVLLRHLLHQRKYAEGLTLASQLLSKAESVGRLGKTIEISIVQALIFHEMHESTQALAALERALQLAQPEGYLRVFLDEGEPMLHLLIQAQSRPGGSAYSAEVLAGMGDYISRTKKPGQPRGESLSPREIEVLDLIQTGYSNQAIAESLFISIPTVKRHISNIYTKLGVENRTQAVSVGRALHMIQ